MHHKDMYQWDFELLVTKTTDTHRVMSDYGGSFTEGMKVNKSIRGILYTRMYHAKCAVVANPTMMSSFNFGTDYLDQFIESHSSGFISYLPTSDNVGKDGYLLNRD